jgi:hypothetical protein
MIGVLVGTVFVGLWIVFALLVASVLREIRDELRKGRKL